MPPMGHLLDVETLKVMFGKAASYFAKQLFLPKNIPLRALRLAAGSSTVVRGGSGL